MTGEQTTILDASATGETVAICAGAGTGKTATLRMIAAARPRTRMLYVAYNRAVRVEAEATFPQNVTCKTAHAIAYRQFGAPMADRLNGPRMTARQNARALGITQPFGLDATTIFEPASLATMALHTVARFCHSADPDIAASHFASPEGLDASQSEALAERVLPQAQRAWEDLTQGSKGGLKPSHDVYLKQWQLSGPDLSGWDVILYDEAQDADPCIAAVLEAQSQAQLIAVGDPAQAIYGWRGAGDFLSRLHAIHRLCLTRSWRFGPAIAAEANIWLDAIGTVMHLVGNPDRPSRTERLDHPGAILCRTNAGTIESLLASYAGGRKAHLVGDGTEMLALARAAERLMSGQPAAHPELVAFGDWPAVQEYAENDPAGSDLAVAVRMINRYGPTAVVRAIETAVPQRSAQVTVSTVHKAKGLEWEQVKIAGDFQQPRDHHSGRLLPIPRSEAMLAYVAVTRAKLLLDIDGLSWVNAHLSALADVDDSCGDEQTEPCALPSNQSRPQQIRPVEAARAGISIIEADPRTHSLDALTTNGPASKRRTGQPRRHPSPSAIPPDDIEEALAVLGFDYGAAIGVDGESGAWVVRGVGKDGSVTCVGGPYNQWRSFPPQRCHLLRTRSRRPRSVR